MRFIATQRAVAGVEKPPSNETERRGGNTIVAFSPALFLNLNNICTLGERCESGMDLGRKAGPKKPGTGEKKARGLNLAWVQGRPPSQVSKAHFFSFTSHNPLDEN